MIAVPAGTARLTMSTTNSTKPNNLARRRVGITNKGNMENFETILESLLNGNVNQAIEQIQALDRPHLFFCELENFELNTDPAQDGRLKFRLLHGLCSNLLSKL